MKRDNERIIEISSQLTDTIQQSLMEFLQAGYTGGHSDLLYAMFGLLHQLGNVPAHISTPLNLPHAVPEQNADLARIQNQLERIETRLSSTREFMDFPQRGEVWRHQTGDRYEIFGLESDEASCQGPTVSFSAVLAATSQEVEILLDYKQPWKFWTVGSNDSKHVAYYHQGHEMLVRPLQEFMGSRDGKPLFTRVRGLTEV